MNWVTEERLVTMAMMADAAQHGLEFVRFWDSPDMDPSTISMEISAFVQKIKTLFVLGKCTRVGHTYHMLELLKKPMPIVRQASGNPLRSIGGVALQGAAASALQRMQCWVSLAIEVIKTEFPDSEFLQCFAIFSLTRGADLRHSLADDSCFASHARRLALKGGMDVRAFTQQFDDVHSLAQSIYATTPRMTCLDAWREALDRKRRRRDVPYDCISRGLQMYAAFH
eukprot:2626251-Pyramimonas_sp.AAC.1